MPSIRPSRTCSRSRTASVTSGARKNAVMNFAEPSGSSPPEKPPGSMTICAPRMASASAFVLSATASGVRLLITSTCASAPARSKARAESYSQFVPGKTGMTTFGRASVWSSTSGACSLHETASTVGRAARSSAGVRYGNTPSMAPSHASCSAASPSFSPPTTSSYASVVTPSSTTSNGCPSSACGVSKSSRASSTSEAAVRRSEQLVSADAAHVQADLVAHAHLEQRLGQPTVARGGHRKRVAARRQLAPRDRAPRGSSPPPARAASRPRPCDSADERARRGCSRA